MARPSIHPILYQAESKADIGVVFSTVSDLLDAIDSSSIGEGDRWVLRWSANSVDSGGEVTGTVDLIDSVLRPNPHPLSVIPVPCSVIGDLWTIANPSSLVYDVDGNPNVIGVGTFGTSGSDLSGYDIAFLDSRLSVKIFSSYRLQGYYNTPLRQSGPEAVYGYRLVSGMHEVGQLGTFTRGMIKWYSTTSLNAVINARAKDGASYSESWGGDNNFLNPCNYVVQSDLQYPNMKAFSGLNLSSYLKYYDIDQDVFSTSREIDTLQFSDDTRRYVPAFGNIGGSSIPSLTHILKSVYLQGATW